MRKTFGIVLFGFWCFGVVACAVGSFIDVSGLNAGDCIRECNIKNDECLNAANSDCPEAKKCFDGLEDCFDDVAKCSQMCTGCEDENTCPEGEDACSDLCVELGKTCTKSIDECMNKKEACINDVVKQKETCFKTFIDCAAVCIDDVQEALK